MTLRVTATEPGPDVDAAAAGAAGAGAETGTRSAWFDGEEHEADVLTGEPEPGTEVSGPGDLRAAGGDAGRPARLGRPRRGLGHDPAGAAA